VDRGERFWTSRLLWRLRGATLWPTFVVMTLVDGVLLHLLPPLRFGFSPAGVPVVAGIIIATFGNLVLVGAITPFLARRLVERRRAQEPSRVSAETMLELMKDRTGTVLLALGTFGVLASGLASIPLINGETDARNRAARALVSYVQGHAPAQIRRSNDQGLAQTVRQGDGLFRSCVPFDDRRRYYCLVIDTNRKPVRVIKDSSAEPNAPSQER
jgi:hypothetical protein